MNQPAISVIVPVYNGCAYLNDLFEQFACQLSNDFEVVFVDDGSVDETYSSLLTWKDNVSFHVIVHHQENQGVSAARNTGLQLATGKYITFVDADDVIAADYFKVLAECIEKDADVAVFQSRRITDPAWKLSEQKEERTEWAFVSCAKQLNDFLHDPTRLGVVNLLVRREYLLSKKIHFSIGYKYYEDYDFLLQLFAQTDKVIRTESVLYYYLMQDGSAMGRFNADRLTCLKLMKDREMWLGERVPDFAVIFREWGCARLYWSVLWQAALALPVYREFKEFTCITNAKKYLKKLYKFPDWTVRISSLVFMVTPGVYWNVMRMLGNRRSKVNPIDFNELKRELEMQPKFWMED